MVCCLPMKGCNKPNRIKAIANGESNIRIGLDKAMIWFNPKVEIKKLPVQVAIKNLPKPIFGKRVPRS